ALAMEHAGADLVDVGGESTRPGSSGISADEESARVLPVLQALRGRIKIPLSIDTQKAEVAEAALDAGARIINDISGLKSDPGIGFGKSFAQNYELLQKLPQLAKLGHPLLVGTSRKGFLGATLARNGKPAHSEERIWGTAATVAASILGGAHIVRVHDVAEM